jgi:hypothetical protein
MCGPDQSCRQRQAGGSRRRGRCDIVEMVTRARFASEHRTSEHRNIQHRTRSTQSLSSKLPAPGSPLQAPRSRLPAPITPADVGEHGCQGLHTRWTFPDGTGHAGCAVWTRRTCVPLSRFDLYLRSARALSCGAYRNLRRRAQEAKTRTACVVRDELHAHPMMW